MELIVVHNAAAGDRTWTRDRVERLLREAGHTPRLIKAKQKRKRRDALAEDADGFVAVGGDGTVHKLLRTVAKRQLPVGILPTGTANNVAHALGYNAGDDLATRVANWSSNERVLQLARVRADGAKRTVVEVCGTGAFAAMRRKTALSAAVLSVDVLSAVRRALAHSVLHTDAVHVSARIDDVARDGNYALLECMNLSFYGPRLRLAPDAKPESALLTVVGVLDAQRAAFAEWIMDGVGDPTAFVIGHGTRISLDVAAPIHVDGKIWPDDHVRRLEIAGGARELRVWV